MPLYQFEWDQVVTREMADFISFSRTTWKLSCWTLLKSESQLAAQKTEGTLAPARCKHLLIQYHRVYTPHSVSEWGPQTTVGSSLSSYTMPNDAQHYISITSFIVNTFIRCIAVEILMVLISDQECLNRVDLDFVFSWQVKLEVPVQAVVDMPEEK